MSNIFIYGTGNMAWALTHGFLSIGIKIAGIYGHTEENAIELSSHFNIPRITDLDAEVKTDDILILAVKDDALLQLNESLRLPGRIVLHTAGSVEMAAIQSISERVGVFYPLQRVRKYQDSAFCGIPICVESSDKQVLVDLLALADKLSGNAIGMDSEQRQKVHIAAVFVSNFANYMFVMGNELLKENNLPSNILDALLKDLIQDVSLERAAEKQTGPARRGDLKVIQSHLKLLEKNPNQEAIYRLLSFEILRYFNG